MRKLVICDRICITIIICAHRKTRFFGRRTEYFLQCTHIPALQLQFQINFCECDITVTLYNVIQLQYTCQKHQQHEQQTSRASTVLSSVASFENPLVKKQLHSNLIQHILIVSVKNSKVRHYSSSKWNYLCPMIKVTEDLDSEQSRRRTLKEDIFKETSILSSVKEYILSINKCRYNVESRERAWLRHNRQIALTSY